MNIIYNGSPATVEKREFYCKAGAYAHRSRVGWAVFQCGRCVLGGTHSDTRGADRNERVDFPTRKGLLEYIGRDAR